MGVVASSTPNLWSYSSRRSDPHPSPNNTRSLHPSLVNEICRSPCTFFSRLFVSHSFIFFSLDFVIFGFILVSKTHLNPSRVRFLCVFLFIFIFIFLWIRSRLSTSIFLTVLLFHRGLWPSVKDNGNFVLLFVHFGKFIEVLIILAA